MVLLFDLAGTKTRLARYEDNQLGVVMQTLESLMGSAALKKCLGVSPREVKGARGWDSKLIVLSESMIRDNNF